MDSRSYRTADEAAVGTIHFYVQPHSPCRHRRTVKLDNSLRLRATAAAAAIVAEAQSLYSCIRQL